MNLIRIGKVIVNFDQVIDIIPGDHDGSQTESLIVSMVGGKTYTFTGDEAVGLQVWVEKSVKTAAKPLDDFIVS